MSHRRRGRAVCYKHKVSLAQEARYFRPTKLKENSHLLQEKRADENGKLHWRHNSIKMQPHTRVSFLDSLWQHRRCYNDGELFHFSCVCYNKETSLELHEPILTQLSSCWCDDVCVRCALRCFLHWLWIYLVEVLLAYGWPQGHCLRWNSV